MEHPENTLRAYRLENGYSTSILAKSYLFIIKGKRTNNTIQVRMRSDPRVHETTEGNSFLI